MTSGEEVPVRHLYFVGVSTTRSSIVTIFPAWAKVLGLDAEIRGLDVPLHAPPEELRAAVDTISTDPEIAGALVTTHKAGVYDAAGTWFDELDDAARLCHEVSCIAVRSGRLLGWAKDPITSRQAYTQLLGPEPWRDGRGDVVCLGAGGAGLALLVAVLGETHQPRRLLLTDRDAGRLELAREVASRLPGRVEVELHHTTTAEHSDDVVASAAPGSLVVNATGMGKDSPGSPVSDAVVFPRGAVAWDMNYRGELDFLRQARAQEWERGLTVADGWRYFLHGWTEVISEVFDVPLDTTLFAQLAEVAATATGRNVSGNAT
jgi:shikimate dehydrogenase